MKEETSGCGYWLQTVDTDVSSGFNNGGCREHAQQRAPPIPLNPWSHLAARLQQRRQHLHALPERDGDLDVERDAAPVRTPRPWSSASRACSGCGFERWQGLIDDVRIYDRPLSAAQIRADMANGV